MVFDDALGGGPPTSPLRALINPKYRGFERCTSLIWDHSRGSVATAKEVVALLPTKLPSLRHLSLTRFRELIGGTQFPTCPVLEKVEMFTHYRSYHAYWGTNFAHVTTLSYGRDGYWLIHDMYTLLLFPALRDLTLVNAHSEMDRMVGHHKPAPLFRHLQTLRVHGKLPPELFTYLVVPAMEALHIEANDFGRTSTDTLRDSFRSLCLHLCPLPSDCPSKRATMGSLPLKVCADMHQD